jgi:glycosyltransferase 2 family protein
LRLISIILALIGLGGSTVLVGWFGFSHVAASLESIGWCGFAIFAGWQLTLFLVLGLAWWMIVPQARARALPLFVWGRMVRDASGNLLPFSALGGFVMGARAVTLHGVGWVRATATTVVDATTEFIAELVFTLIGLGILLARAPDSALLLPLAGGLLLAMVGAAIFVWLQQGATPLLRALGRRVAGNRFGGAREQFVRMQAVLDRIYADPWCVAGGATLHLLGWMATAGGSWIAYRLLGARIDLPAVLAIEALSDAALSAAFLVPIGAGVQEAAYAGLGTIFGLPPEMSLAVSLLRRGRDIVLGVPVLLIWQGLEMARLRASGRKKARGAALQPLKP